jgi:CHASE3 domain sensor protein
LLGLVYTKFMNPIQIVTLVSILTITICLVFLTIWIVKVLKQFKETVIKTNLILDDAKLITENINQPISQFRDFFVGLKEGIAFFSNLFKKDD